MLVNWSFRAILILTLLFLLFDLGLFLQRGASDGGLALSALFHFLGFLTVLTLHTVRFLRNKGTAMLSSGNFLRTFIEQSPLGILVLDFRSARVVKGNSSAKEILGLPADFSLAGHHALVESPPWQVLTPDGRRYSRETNPLRRVFDDQTSRTELLMVKRKDGTLRFVVFNGSTVKDHRDRPVAVLVSLLDVTELHRTEHQLQKLNAELEDRVAQRTQELQETQKHLAEAERLASLGQLVSGVAHEINTPVGVGVTAASILAEATSRLIDLHHSGQMKKSDLEGFLETATESSTIVLDNLKRASDLIRSFKMISADQHSDQIRELDLKSYLEDLCGSLPLDSQDLDLKIAVEGPEDLKVDTYPGALSRIISQLCLNSCQHGFKNQAQGRIEIRVQPLGEGALIVFEDDGRGMEPEVIKRIFEPFFTTNRGEGSAGLGMHMVYNLVTGPLGGRIQAESPRGRGARFTIQLPPAPCPTTPDKPGSRRQESPPAEGLCRDDEPEGILEASFAG